MGKSHGQPSYKHWAQGSFRKKRCSIRSRQGADTAESEQESGEVEKGGDQVNDWL